MDRIERIRRGELTGVDPVERVDRVRLLSPAEREEARRQREEKRREVEERERSAQRPPKKSPQDPSRGSDYFG